MKIINGAAFRKRQAGHLNECESTGTPLLIMTQKQGKEPQQMIVLTKAQYDLMIKKISEVDV